MPFFKKYNGFTLIELLTVIAIIGLLVSFAAVGLAYYKKKGQDASIQIGIGQIRNAAEMYYSAHKDFLGICDNDPSSSDYRRLIYSSDFEAEDIVGSIIMSRGDVYCKSSFNAYVVISAMNIMDCWCVDSAGSSKEATLNPGETCADKLIGTQCP